MGIVESVVRQYGASLDMLEQAVERCPDPVWDADVPAKYWRVAYHALFYTSLYLQESEKNIVRWKGYRENYHHLGRLPWPPHEIPVIGAPYTKAEVLEYLAYCRIEVASRVPPVDFSAPSGFHWVHADKLELQIYNIRHLQHHTGQLVERLKQVGLSVPWIITKG